MKPRAILGWTGGYTALTLLLTYPLVLHLSTTVPHDLGDPLLSTSLLWWNAHVLPLTARWWDGFAYFPAHGFLAYSDHRLGESLIATPLQWLGASPVIAYNVTLLATFPLSALGAHWLAFTLTRRHDAAAICGLAYGFNPYRMAHIEHLELLAAFGMPVALVGLHQYVTTRRRRWLALFPAALVLQGFCTSYYLLFFSVFLVLWLIWFLRWRDAKVLAPILIAGAAAAALLLPIVIGYLRIHRHYDFARPYGDIVRLSADVTSLVTAAPISALWGWTSGLNGPERQLFPGLTIAALAVSGAVCGWRAHAVARDRLDRAGLWLLPPALAFAAIAICGWILPPWRIGAAGITVSSTAPFKAMSLAILAVAAAIALSSHVRDAFARRSLLGFYVFAAASMFVCSFGPKPMWLGHQILYEPPYAWLMRLPVFGSVRAPARFAMPAVLALSVTGALSFNRLGLGRTKRLAFAIVLATAIVADSWLHNLALPRVPDVWPAERAAGFAAVLELPLGDTLDDVAAMYRAIDHGRLVVNGYSGFEAVHYPTLALALHERDPSALDPIVSAGPVLGVVHKPLDKNGSWQQLLLTLQGATRLGDDEDHFFFALPPQPPPAPVCEGMPLPLVTVSDGRGAIDIGALTDGDPSSFWATPGPARAGDAVVIDLGHPAQPCAVSLGMGVSRVNYARKLIVETSLDAGTWTPVAARRLAGPMVRALLEKPRGAAIAIPLAPAIARFVRLRVDESSEKDEWVIAELSVTGARRPG